MLRSNGRYLTPLSIPFQYLDLFQKKIKKIETILYGNDVDNNDIFTTNVLLQLATHKYILQTKRLS